MKKQRGSASVLALVFLLFLSVAGGAWVTMLAHENSTAMNDQKDQQAWYAAEAGMKRAKAELVYKKNSISEWQKWLTQNKNFSNKGTTISVAKGTKNNDANTAKYAVYIGYDDTNVYSSGMGTGKKTYEITSVGYYMDSAKIIKEEIEVGGTGGSGGGGSTNPPEDDYSLGDALAAAKGTVTLSNSQATGNLAGNLYGSTVIDHTGAQFASPYNKGAYTGTLLTHIPAAVFQQETYASQKTVSFSSGNSVELAADTNYVWNMDTNYKAWWILNATAASGSTIYLTHTDALKATTYNFTLKGPTSGKPLTIVIPFACTYFNPAVSSGSRIRILTSTDIVLGNAEGSNVKWLIASNGNVTSDRQINGDNGAYGFISSDKNIYMLNQGFRGQMQAAGNISLGGTYNYSSAVLDDAYFHLPYGMTESS